MSAQKEKVAGESIKLRDETNFFARHKREIALALVIVLCGAGAGVLARGMDARRAARISEVARQASDEELYANAGFVRRVVPPAFRGLVADYYWMRALQYVGRKALTHEGDLQLDDLSALDLRLLAPLLDTATTLDPQFTAVYEYGAVVLPVVDPEAAIELVSKGIERNPQAWRLYHQLGYIYWHQEKFSDASRVYRAGARIAGAPAWMNSMAAQMEGAGGSRAVAREMFRRMLEESDDEQIKINAARRLLWLRSLDERDVIRRTLGDFRARAGRCPARWAEVAREIARLNLRLDANGAPLDPTDKVYVLTNDGCDVGLNADSEIPARW